MTKGKGYQGDDGKFRRGNPGRPKGARPKYLVAADALLEGEAEKLTRKAIERAKAGDATALRLCLERLVPPRKERPISLDLPTAEGLTSLAQTMAQLLLALGRGEITPGEAAEVAKLIEGHRRLVETEELERRVAALEAKQGNGR